MQRLTCDAAMVDQRPRYRDGRGIGEQIDVGLLDRQHLIGVHRHDVMAHRKAEHARHHPQSLRLRHRTHPQQLLTGLTRP